MDFTDILKGLTERTNAKGAVIVDKDGEPVASTATGGLDIDLVGAHFEVVLDCANEVLFSRGGPAISLQLSTDKTRIAVLAMKEGYCLVVALDRATNPGKIMREATKAVKAIEAEMG